MEIRRVAVVGSGTMGNGIAHVCAVAGLDVRLVDVARDALDRALATIGTNMERQVKKGTLDASASAKALARIATGTDPAAAAAAADLVIEAVPERAEMKYELFRTLDGAAPPGAILASNTSSISITEIAARTARPDRVIGMHFMNPVPVMELVEVIRGLATSDETTAAVIALAERLG
ncbi:MAG: 3-hydroxybutyryl-CoA dehydrogenase, partial [Gemmatimonadetes bacterium]|nr:3-hydroxybutyryl-CoA dehydrogenase [Gemmatimonadota bacterium]